MKTMSVARVPRLCAVFLAFAIGGMVTGQVTASRLRMVFGNPVNGAYAAGPGITLIATDGPGGEICVLKIVGPTSEDEVLKVFDLAVPVSARGIARGRMMECVGGCTWDLNYERIRMSYAVMKGQISKPAAIVYSTSRGCEKQVKESAAAEGFAITKAR